VKISLLVLPCLFAVQGSWGDQVDAASIARILGKDALHRLDASESGNLEKLLEGLAATETKLLDRANKDWNASNPKWKAVFDRVHSDIEADAPQIIAAIKAAARKREEEFEAQIAARLSRPDLNAMRAYYDSPQGRRYEAFMHRVDHVMASGGAALNRSGTDASSRAKVSDEQSQQYVHLLQFSHLYQAMQVMSADDQAARRATSGYEAIGYMAGEAAARNQAEMAAVFADYAADLPSFEAFERTDASQHLFRAIGLAIRATGNNANPIAGSIKAVTQKHENEWQAAYRSR
jgi:hypothetical protein